MEPIGSLPCSQVPVTGPCIGSGQSNSDRYTLLSILFFTCFLIKIWYAFLTYTMRTICPTHLTLLKVITLILFGEESKSGIISSCSFPLLFSLSSAVTYYLVKWLSVNFKCGLGLWAGALGCIFWSLKLRTSLGLTPSPVRTFPKTLHARL
jgi:hypothetical protein